jgi:hypothetical protein
MRLAMATQLLDTMHGQIRVADEKIRDYSVPPPCLQRLFPSTRSNSFFNDPAVGSRS